MQENTAKSQTGFLLGMALMILAGSMKLFGDFIYAPMARAAGHTDPEFDLFHHHNDFVIKDNNKVITQADHHPEIKGNAIALFCWCGLIGNIAACVVATYLWLAQVAEKKAEIAAEEAEFTDSDSDDENDAENDASK